MGKRRLRRHITYKELSCPCGKCEPIINDEFLDRVEAARVIAGIPFSFSSFYRCTEYNKAVGGASNSPHPLGIGCDVRTRGQRRRARRISNALYKVGFIGIEIGSRHIHFDDMKRKSGSVLWSTISK